MRNTNRLKILSVTTAILGVITLHPLPLSVGVVTGAAIEDKTGNKKYFTVNFWLTVVTLVARLVYS